MPRPRPARQPVASKELLGFFWNLADIEPATRCESAASLVAHLRVAHERSRAVGGPAAADGAPPCAEVAYAAQRLVRGLSSSRDCARQGFALALTRLLRGDESDANAADAEALLSPAHVLALIGSELSGGAKGAAEEREQAIGFFFAHAAIVRSGRLLLPAPAAPAAGTGAVLAAEAPAVLRGLGVASARRWFLAEGSALLCTQLVEEAAAAARAAHGGGGDGAARAARPLVAEVAAAVGGAGAALPELSPDRLLLLLRAGPALASAGLGAELAASLPLLPLAPASGRLLSVGSAPLLLEPLRAASCAHPRLHAVWDALLADLAPLPPTTGSAGVATFEPGLLGAVWSAVVDEGLMASPSAERK